MKSRKEIIVETVERLFEIDHNAIIKRLHDKKKKLAAEQNVTSDFRLSDQIAKIERLIPIVKEKQNKQEVERILKRGRSVP